MRVDCEDGAVAGEREAEGFVEAVHGIGGEHAGAGAATWAACFLDAREIFRGNLADGFGTDCFEDGVEVGVRACERMFAGGHWAA